MRALTVLCRYRVVNRARYAWIQSDIHETALEDNRMMSLGRRWDGDTRGTGIGGGEWITDDVDQFKAALTEPNWITEEPAQHLLPHLR